MSLPPRRRRLLARLGVTSLVACVSALGVATFACSVGDLDEIGKRCSGTTCPGGAICANGACVRDCGGTTINLEKSVPRLVGTQAVDGNDDDFCGVPTHTLTAADAVQDGPLPPPGFHADVRAAWSSDALHLFVHVPKFPVLPPPSQGAIYFGDAVELCLSTLSEPDASIGQRGTTHIIVAPLGADGSPGGRVEALVTDTTDPAPFTAPRKFATRIEEGVGYDVELEVPWSTLDATTPLSPGTVIRLAVGVDLNIPVDGGSPWQQLYLKGAGMTNQKSSTCDPHPNAYPGCDDRTWAKPELTDP